MQLAVIRYSFSNILLQYLLMGRTIFLREEGENSKEIVYVKGPDNSIISLNASLSPRDNIKYFLKNILKEILLPQGYPETVSEDYAKYQIWDTVQAFCSTITNTIATKSVLQGVGVGDSTATSLSAAVTWVLSDGIGMITSISFAWLTGSKLDGECKKWRMFADILNDIAICIEVAILPILKTFSMAILCLSSSLRFIVFVAGGGTRAAITQHQAVSNNMADVSAKDGSQEKCVNLLGSFMGLFILTFLGNSSAIWYIFFGITFTHVFANYMAMKTLNFNTFNTERLLHVLREYLTTGQLLPPIDVNRQESVFLGFGLRCMDVCGYNIKMGYSIEKLIKKKLIYPFELQLVTHIYRNRKYLIIVDINNKVIYIVLEKSYSSEDIVEAFVHAVFQGLCAAHVTRSKESLEVMMNRKLLDNQNDVVNKIIKAAQGGKSEGKVIQSRVDADIIIAVDNLAAQEICNLFPAMIKCGWSLNSNYLYIGKWRACWKENSATEDDKAPSK